jgi:hypothetical protein
MQKRPSGIGVRAARSEMRRLIAARAWDETLEAWLSRELKP